MKVIFDSKTGNVEHFVKKLPFPCFSVKEVDKLDEPFVLITFTTGMGQVPSTTINFLEENENHKLMLGVSSSGNRVWGKSYGIAANVISEKYKKPIISKFELSGDNYDVEYFIKKVGELFV